MLGIFHTSSANTVYKVCLANMYDLKSLKNFFPKILMDVLTSLNASFSPLKSTEFSKSPDFLLELPR